MSDSKESDKKRFYCKGKRVTKSEYERRLKVLFCTVARLLVPI